jgi:proteasome lid subunit RPN8/RPN11
MAGKAENVPPDAGRVACDEFPKRALPAVQGKRQPGFQVVARRSALNAVYRHGHGSPSVEVCGVLVGNVYHDDAGPYLYIEASIRGEHAGSQDAQVTFTAATWTHVQDEMDRHHPDRRMLGWYHTHPRFGIFLSGMDLFIQQNFFGLPWQVAFVYDPVGGDEGVFIWREGNPVRESFLVEEDAVSAKLQTVPRGASGPGLLAEEPAARLETVERQQKWLLGGVAGVAVLMLFWPLVWSGLRPAPVDGAAREWDEHFLRELVQLRAQAEKLRGDVLGLRRQVAQFQNAMDVRLPPPSAPELSPMEVAVALLTGDLLPGPPRPLPGSLVPALVLSAELARATRDSRRARPALAPLRFPFEKD